MHLPLFLFIDGNFFKAVFVSSVCSILFLLATLLDNKWQLFLFCRTVTDGHMSFRTFRNFIPFILTGGK